MELQVHDKMIDTSPIRRLITQGENGVDTFTIPLPKMRGKTDLAALTYTMRGVSGKDTLAAQLLEKTVEPERVWLKWDITGDFTAVDGPLTLDVTGVNENGAEIIHYNAGKIDIGKVDGKDFQPPQLDVFEQLLTQAQAALQAATEQANLAKVEAEKLLQAGINFKILGFYPTLEALQAAAPSPAQGDAYGVGESPVFVYLWDGAQWQQGQALGIDLAEYCTKAEVEGKLEPYATKAVVGAELSNKANVDEVSKQLGDKMDNSLAVSGTNLLTWATLQTVSGCFSIGNTMNGTPVASWYNGLLETPFVGGQKITLTRRVPPYDTWTNIYVGNEWQEWVHFAIATSGTWTPVITDINGHVVSLDIAETYGKWTLTGNVMLVTARIKVVSKAGLDNIGIYIQGLPRTASPVYQGGVIGYYSGLSTQTEIYIETTGSGRVNLYKPSGNGGMVRLNADDITDNLLLEAISINYMV